MLFTPDDNATLVATIADPRDARNAAISWERERLDWEREKELLTIDRLMRGRSAVRCS